MRYRRYVKTLNTVLVLTMCVCLTIRPAYVFGGPCRDAIIAESLAACQALEDANAQANIDYFAAVADADAYYGLANLAVSNGTVVCQEAYEVRGWEIDAAIITVGIHLAAEEAVCMLLGIATGVGAAAIPLCLEAAFQRFTLLIIPVLYLIVVAADEFENCRAPYNDMQEEANSAYAAAVEQAGAAKQQAIDDASAVQAAQVEAAGIALANCPPDDDDEGDGTGGDGDGGDGDGGDGDGGDGDGN